MIFRPSFGGKESDGAQLSRWGTYRRTGHIQEDVMDPLTAAAVWGVSLVGIAALVRAASRAGHGGPDPDAHFED